MAGYSEPEPVALRDALLDSQTVVRKVPGRGVKWVGKMDG